MEHTTHEENINWICDQIREACANTQGLSAEKILTLTCSLESSVAQYYWTCDADTSLGEVVEHYLADEATKAHTS